MNRIPALTVSAIPFPQSAIRNPLFPLLPFLLSIFYFLVLASSTLAQSPKPDIPNLLRSPDPAQRNQALTLALAQIDQAGPKLDAGPVRDWIATLRSDKHHAEALQLIDRALPHFQGRDNSMAVRFMAYKAAVSLDLGHKEAAVAFLIDGLRIDAQAAISTAGELQLSEPMVHAGLLTQYLEMIDQAIVAWADDHGMLERALSLRIKALLAAKQPQQALASAKSLYNVSTMADTAKALSAVAACLQAAYPKDRDILTRFRDQQIAGAALPASSSPALPPSPPPALSATSTILGQVKLTATLYEKSLGNNLLPTLAEEDFNKLTRAGNLLLLADRPLDAKLWFEQAYRVCNKDQLPYATESLARALKAEDSTIGRANAFLLSLRPTKPTPK